MSDPVGSRRVPVGSKLEFVTVQAPTAGAVGIAEAAWTVSRGSRTVRIVARARTDIRSRAVTVRVAGGSSWCAGLEYAVMRWSPEDGPGDLVLTWRAVPPPGYAPDDSLGYAEVSDVLLLAKTRTAQWAVRALYGALARAGRPDESDERRALYRTTILSLHKAGWATSRITARTVLQRMGRTGDDSQLRADVTAEGGWRGFRAEVIAGE